MKTKLIMLDTPIIVSDEEIKKSDWFYSLPRKTLHKCTAIFENNLIDNSWQGRERVEIIKADCYKIIAGIEGLPSIDWNGLEEEFGWIDIEKLAKEATNKQIIRIFGNESKEEIEDDIQKRKYYFKEGFKKAQSLNDKKFSLEDMFKCFQAGIDYEKEGIILRPDVYGYLRFLQQPKVFDIEIETEEVRPKIVHNSIKIIKKLISYEN